MAEEPADKVKVELTLPKDEVRLEGNLSMAEKASQISQAEDKLKQKAEEVKEKEKKLKDREKKIKAKEKQHDIDKDDIEAPEPQLSPGSSGKTAEDLKPEKTRKELEAAIKGSDETIVEITTPWQIFPVTLTLDRAKIGASKRTLFSSTGIMSLPMDDVRNVSAEVGGLLGTVEVDKAVMTDEEFKFGGFRRKDALKFAATAQGYVIALKREIDLSALSTEELKSKLKELGKDEGVNYEGV